MFRSLMFIFLMILGIWGCSESPENVNSASFDPLHSHASTPLSTTYWFEGQPVPLVSGRFETEPRQGDATTTVTRVIEPLIYGDLNQDQAEDAAVILVQDPGGSGSFYYLAAALHDDNIWQGTDALFLGDRIKPSELTIEDDVIVIHYFDRRLHEPMAVEPTIDTTRSFFIRNRKLVEMKAGDQENPNRLLK